MTIQDVMKRDVECIAPTDPARLAAQRMAEENVGFLPVCEESGRVIGTVTDRDLAIRLVGQGRSFETPVSEVMTREVVACSPSDSLRKAEKVMAERHKSRLICLEEGRLVGVLSLSDIAQEEREPDFIAETIRQISEREASPA